MESLNIKFNRLHDALHIDGDRAAETPGQGDRGGGTRGSRGKGARCTAVPGSAGAVAVVVGMFSLFLVISYNKWDINTKYTSLMAALNMSHRVQDNYNAEMQTIGAKINVAWRNLSRLDKSQDTFKKSKPWLIDINDAKADMEDKLRDVALRVDKSDASVALLNTSLDNTMKELKDKTEDLERKIESAKNIANRDLAQITNIRKFIQEKIGNVSNTSRDLTIAHNDMKENVYQVICSH